MIKIKIDRSRILDKTGRTLDRRKKKASHPGVETAISAMKAGGKAVKWLTGQAPLRRGDALYSATIKLGQPRPSDPSAASRLHELLGYVEQVIKLDEKAVFRLAEHRLANGQIYQYHQNEFHALPGVKHDATDNDGPIWLTMERLKRHHPPKLMESLEIWLEISPDPERTPVVRESVLDTVSASVRDSLVAEQKVRPEDCQPAFGPDGKGKFDIRYRIEDHPEITAEADAYLAGPWLAWANEERPRRRSIALYQRLFEVAQLAELGGPEQPIELVWGIGLSRWTHEGTLVDLPLLERLVEIEIDERAAGLLRIRPRQADAAINLRPYEELKLEGLPLAQNAARRALALSAEEEGVSPYLRETFEPILRACQSHIDAEGRYLPDGETLDPTAQVPAATAQLTVSDRWVIFARKRNDNFLLKDIENLQKSIEQEKEILPGPALTLVTGPERATSGAWKPLTDVIGGAAATFEAEEPESPLGDLFFPKPFNSEQIEIVRRLEKTDGVVVQGPPGTGKTHTISNIICHYLATGRRVLVVSHGEAALSVLREKLPEQVRDLAISITTSEREGLKQLEGAIRLLQSVVQTLRPGEQKRVIRDIESSIVAMRARIAAIDVEMERAARLQLSEVAGRGVRPAQLAKSVVTGRSSCAWLDDRPQAFLSETQITLADIDALRRARIALGPRLEYFDAELPSVSDLPSGAALAQLHADILGAQEHAARANANPAFVPRIATLEAVSAADSGASALDALLDAMRHFDGFPWLRSFAVPGSTSEHATHIPALQAFMGDAAAILDEYKRYVQSPVNLPDGVEDGSAFAGIINKLAEGQNAFGLFAFGAKKLKPLIDEVRVVGRKPRDAQEWSHVKAFLNWRIRFSELSARWDAVSASLSLNDRPAFSIRYLVALVEAVQTILVTVPKTRRHLMGCLQQTMAKATCEVWPNAALMRELCDCLRSAAASTRLSASRAEVSRAASLFTERSGKLASVARNFLIERVGSKGITSEQIAAAWDKLIALLDDVAQHRPHFDALRDVTGRIDAAGAPKWANRLRREQAEKESDLQVPANWPEAWDWAAAEYHLGRIDQREAVRALAEERARLDADIAQAFERLVRERTFYGLAQSMTGPVRSALMMFATALRQIGTGRSIGAARHRRAARQAMAGCYGGVPCWIMPSWRVAEQLPGELGTFDLVIMDEASQSDIKEVTTLLRGKKVLVVGDDKQVSPSAAFIENAKIDRLERTYLAKQPFKTLLLPGASLYDLAKVMFPDKFVMLREHFRCVEPIIQFSTQFYTEALIPLRIPTAQERLDPPLIDIYVPDGRRSGDKINHREAEVIVEEISHIIKTPALAAKGPQSYRSIGVISLIGGKQAALINRMLLEALGEEIVLRHRIACGDSATFQGNERDIVLLSMVADPAKKQAQTATHFEQRFNVAMSRARDRLYLVRSVREEELNPKDLKANVIRHMREPMKEGPRASGELAALCDSDFEREILGRLLARGYHVTPQVGAMGYSIDMVVEGLGDQRLAIECDGDQYHGPERWADDMQRQRVLERVGWRFWRCWASSFTLDPDGCMADLFDTLGRNGIQPAPTETSARAYTEHRDAKPKRLEPEAESKRPAKTGSSEGIRVGDRVIVRDLDDNKTMSFELSATRDDPVNGFVSISSTLGAQLIGCHQEDEIEFEASDKTKRILIVRTEREKAVA